MADFGTWMREWSDGNWLGQEFAEALAYLAAQLYEAASPFGALQDKATDSRVGLTQPVTVAEAVALNDALDACKEFMEKYSQKGDGDE